MRNISLLALLIVISSCSSVIDTTLAPPPVAVQKGDLTIDAGISELPFTGGVAPTIGQSFDRHSLAVQLGIGYAYSDLDNLYFNTTISEGITDEIGLTNSARYLRKLRLPWSFEHFVGGQIQTFTVLNPVVEPYSSFGIGAQYIGRYNSAGGLQPYWGVNLGYGMSNYEIDALIGSLNIGIQYRVLDWLEMRLEMGQAIGYQDVVEFTNNVSSFSLHLRYIF